MTIGEVLRDAVARLTAAGVDGAAGDARRLLAHVIGVAPDRLILMQTDTLADAQHSVYSALIVARMARQPVSQITGERWFWGRRFRVTRDTLDPRPETECLIEVALRQRFATVLDLGTGTGCILLTLLAEIPDATGIGTDISAAALAVARANAAALGLERRADFRISDWYGGVTGRYDLIVSNPPYIAQDEMAGLAPDVRDWEPHLALSPGGDGLGAYRALVAGADAVLADGGRLIVEIGPTQAEAVLALLRRAGFGRTAVHRDLDGRDRVITAERV